MFPVRLSLGHRVWIEFGPEACVPCIWQGVSEMAEKQALPLDRALQDKARGSP